MRKQSVLLLVIICTGLLTPPRPGFAAPPRADDLDVAAVFQRIDTFLARIGEGIGKEGALDAAFANLFVESPLSQRPESRKSMVEKVSQFETLYGSYIGRERITFQAVGEDVFVTKYLYKAERFPVVWYFTYYRAGNGAAWKLISVRFDTRVEKLAR